MTIAITDTAFDVPARAAARPSATPPLADAAPRLGGVARLVGLVAQGLTASWVPLCPDLTSEIARGAGRRD